MKFKIALATLAVAGASMSFLPQADAAYVTAYHRMLAEETLLVDTDSINESGVDSFAVLVYDILNDGKTETKRGNTYRFRFDADKTQWQILVKGDGDEKTWEVVEKNSNAQDVLRVCLPYLHKSADSTEGE